ncbi:MAG TPA: hypothetical protein VL688_09780, partial [Verrucomicrobiae bacterium]|nr:hypothetical protein [Verrucomicrobiae bacterium]
EWEPEEGRLDENLMKNGLHEVLKFCETHNIRVVIAVHCSFWGVSGNWTVPAWIQKRPEFRVSTNVLTKPEFRDAYISFLNRLIDTTRGYEAVKGYNILNEPVVATSWYVKDSKGRADFQTRWEGTLEIGERVKQHLQEESIPQFLVIGNGNADPGYEPYVWENTGKRDLRPFWTNVMDRIAAQGTPALLASVKDYPDRARLRTEGALTYAVLKAWREAGDPAEIKTRWLDTSDASAVIYDYDAAYDYEGLANAAVPGLEAFYVWRVGSIESSPRFVGLLDRENKGTPYYAALRDLASGVDSFEALGSLPESGKEALRFDPDKAPAAVSKRWSGSGRIEGEKENLPPDVESRAAARITLGPGQSVFRSVIPAHWKDNGVTAADGFTFWAQAGKEIPLTLAVKAGNKSFPASVTLTAGTWKEYHVPFQALGLADTDLTAVTDVGFENASGATAEFVIDDFLIRGS